jgi:hypothetical protein
MRVQDQVFLAVAMWKENREAGVRGMQSVGNVLMNRAAKRKTNEYTECTRPLQISSLTAKGDPELTLWPQDSDPTWQTALDLAAHAAAGILVDITNGATLYYAPEGQSWKQRFTLPNGSVIAFPDDWNKEAVAYTAEIGSQYFFKEVN